MAVQPIDFSSGLVSAAPAQSAGVDYSAGLVAQPSPAPSQAGAQRQPQDLEAQVDPAHPEGVYKMNSPQGKLRSIPYSNVGLALQQGHLFADKGGLQQYARDHAADPLNEDRIDKFLSQHPEIDALIPGGVSMAYGALKGVGTGMAKTLTAFDKTPTSRLETDLQLAAATPSNTLPEQAGEAGENVGEFFTGEELLSLLGKGAAALPMVAKLKAMTGVAEMLQKSRVLAKLAKIGSVAVKQGTVGAGQTYVKTGGDADAAAGSGALTAAIGAGADLVGPAARGALRAIVKPSDEAAETAAANESAVAARASEREASSVGYSQVARDAAEPHLNAINDSISRAGAPPESAASTTPQRAGQPGAQALTPGADLARTNELATRQVGPDLARTNELATRQVGPGNPGAETPLKPSGTRAIDTNAVLSQIHDFTGAADKLTEINQAGYDALDKITDGKFRQMNTEVAAAQKAAWRGGDAEKAAYQNKLAEMNSLLSTTNGRVPPETLQALKASWRQSYQLRDFGDIWDRNLSGLPGKSAVSNTQRGINGKGLRDDLVRAIKLYTRPEIEKSLGPGRLDSLEEIADNNMTDKQRAIFNLGVRNTAAGLEIGEKKGAPAIPTSIKGHAAGLAAGLVTHVAGGPWYMGALGGEVSYYGIKRVMDAVKSDPVIARNLLFAIGSGAKPENYGPFIAGMIKDRIKLAAQAGAAHYVANVSRERQAKQAQKGDGEQ
jgi:hypothetical protein